MGKTGLPPPPNSYGAEPTSELGVWFLQIQPQGCVVVPSATGGRGINRKAYFVEGKSVQFTNQRVQSGNEITLDASIDAEIVNDTDALAEILILQGKPLNEPVAQRGPFVMNTADEIQQAFMDYRRTQFGGWPWPQDAMVFPASKGRFTLQDGKETFPPTVGNTCSANS
jgi:hypothetical protein